MKCAFTGHREMDKNFDGELFERALEGLIAMGCNVFYDGMARGFDLYAAKKIIDLKKIYDIKLVACIPYGGQIDSMREDDRRAYESILKDCDDIKCSPQTITPGVCTRETDIWWTMRTLFSPTSMAERAAHITR